VKILYHHRVGSRDGQAVHVDEIVSALRALGHEVAIVAPPGFERSSFGGRSAPIELVRRNLPGVAYEVIELFYNASTYLRLRRALRKERPDVIYERYGLFLFAGVLASRRRGVPLLLEVNSPLAQERRAFGGLALSGVARRIEKYVWRGASHVLPVSNVLADMVRAAGVPAERVTVIRNGIALDRFAPADSRAAKARIGLEDKIVLGFAGFMRAWHGLDDVIDLLARPDAPRSLHLLVVGDGPARPDLMAKTARLGIQDRVTFTGLVERNAIADYVGAFDIALQPKAVAYASPLKLFEYMALGKAIVAPDQPNIREVLRRDIDALLFDPGRPADMAAMVFRLAADAALRARLGAAARATIVERRLTWRDNAERIAAIAARAAVP